MVQVCDNSGWVYPLVRDCNENSFYTALSKYRYLKAQGQIRPGQQQPMLHTSVPPVFQLLSSRAISHKLARYL